MLSTRTPALWACKDDGYFWHTFLQVVGLNIMGVTLNATSQNLAQNNIHTHTHAACDARCELAQQLAIFLLHRFCLSGKHHGGDTECNLSSRFLPARRTGCGMCVITITENAAIACNIRTFPVGKKANTVSCIVRCSSTLKQRALACCNKPCPIH